MGELQAVSPSLSGADAPPEPPTANQTTTYLINNFNDVGTALDSIPLSGGGITTPNSTFNVTTVKTTC